MSLDFFTFLISGPVLLYTAHCYVRRTWRLRTRSDTRRRSFAAIDCGRSSWTSEIEAERTPAGNDLRGGGGLGQTGGAGRKRNRRFNSCGLGVRNLFFVLEHASLPLSGRSKRHTSTVPAVDGDASNAAGRCSSPFPKSKPPATPSARREGTIDPKLMITDEVNAVRTVWSEDASVINHLEGRLEVTCICFLRVTGVASFLRGREGLVAHNS